MKAKNLTFYSFLCLVCSILVWSCKKQDHYYKEFIKDGEIIYVGKADSVNVYPGKNRIRLSWKVSDPNITKMKVLWNSGQDSIVMNVSKSQGKDSLSMDINNLEERFYSFEIVSLDSAGNTSVKVLAEGQVYGDLYTASLLNRAIDKVTYKDQKASITWFNSSLEAISTEIYYQDKNGADKMKSVAASINSAVLENVNSGMIFKYRTLFLPDSAAIDTFYSAYDTYQIK